MSLTKKDPSFCVAANDPHLVSLGGGRLSTAVTIHNVPIGDTTIGSSTRCSISLNGSGIRPLHCTIYRSEENEVTLVPERDARILIDGHKIDDEINLTQGAMITVGKSYYLRFNNPAEAQQIRTAMGSNERISMPQIDFGPERQRHSAKSCTSNGTSSSGEVTAYEINSFYESTIQPPSLRHEGNHDNSYVKTIANAYNNLAPIDINGLHCPKVFTADLVTVNMPAKDVLGQKYSKFARNFAENHRNEKNLNHAWHNSQNLTTDGRSNGNVYDNVPPTKANNQETSSRNAEYLTKLKHANEAHKQTVTAYDRYPKLGNMQIFPMTTINNEINIQTSPKNQINPFPSSSSCQFSDKKESNGYITIDERENLDDMLKICSEYTDRQNQNSSSNCGSMSSSPIVQNRIKTNGSLPREKKSPFQTDVTQQSVEGSFNNPAETAGSPNYSSGYENVRLVGPNRVELNGQLVTSPKSAYENVVIGKYVPQSPRTKIRTNCMSPKREQSFASMFSQQKAEPQSLNNIGKTNKQVEYDELLKTFGEKLEQEMQNIQECSRYQPPKSIKCTTYSQNSRSNKNINNLKLNLKPPSSLQNSPKPIKKPAPAPRTLLKYGNNSAGGSLPHLAEGNHAAAAVDKRENNKKFDLDSLALSKQELENILDMLQDKIHRLEAQRNATRVMEENQQAKLKQSVEMKLDQIKKLKDMLKQKPNNECLKEELKNIGDALDNDRKQFEDLEFQYLEEESEWHAYHEELKSEEKLIIQQIEDKEREVQHIPSPLNAKTAVNNKHNTNTNCELNNCIASKTKSFNSSGLIDSALNKPYDIGEAIGIMSQSLFGSAEILCPKRNNDNEIMSKSVNENIFFSNKIEFGSSSAAAACSTPKRPQLQIVNIDDSPLSAGYKQSNISKSCESFTQPMHFNLSLGSDDFEVNPLEKRVPSQDDIDRITKVTSDAPISSQGATTKIFDSIKEIERNRQLLLAQQGHHVIEHERQKMSDLKKKMHTEARAQYISMFSRNGTDGINAQNDSQSSQRPAQKQQQEQQHLQQQEHALIDKENQPNVEKLLVSTKNSQNSTAKHNDEFLDQQRHSQPEFETTSQRHYDDHHKRHSANSRPLSEANSDNGTEHLSHKNASKSNMELSTNNNFAMDKRLSSNSNDVGISSAASQKVHKDFSDSGERKRILLKHQRPLTRYLPIFSPDLDLRQHIESAGHQITLCPHVFIDSNSCRGYLHKLGATFHGWSKRWFVLDRQRNAFIYYSDKLERKPRGGAYFSTIDEVYLDHLNISKSGRPHCTFIVKTKKRSYQLQAASDAAARIWIDAIITGAQGNLDY